MEAEFPTVLRLLNELVELAGTEDDPRDNQSLLHEGTPLNHPQCIADDFLRVSLT